MRIFQLTAALAAALTVLASCVMADEIGPPTALASVGPNPPVTAYNGSYTYNVPIEAPAFRGLEPRLSLSYDSARGIRNATGAGGWLGVGWELEGISFIERVSGDASVEKTGGRGSPNFGMIPGLPEDRHVLDGLELVPCAELPAAEQNKAPSCMAGGSHASRIESFNRIKQIDGDNTWEVTARDGTLYRYNPIGGPAPTFRWKLETVTDTKGNFVEYTYDTCSETACVIMRIDYFNAGTLATAQPVYSIRFYWEARSGADVIEMATGRGFSKIDKRIKTIAICAGHTAPCAEGQQVRAYKLAYELSPSTGLSRLTSVQQFGKDYGFGQSGTAEAGTVIDGTALPPTLFTYQDGAGFELKTGSGWGIDSRGSLAVADLNGDGRSDIIWTNNPIVWTDRSKPFVDGERQVSQYTICETKILNRDWKRIYTT